MEEPTESAQVTVLPATLAEENGVPVVLLAGGGKLILPGNLKTRLEPHVKKALDHSAPLEVTKESAESNRIADIQPPNVEEAAKLIKEVAPPDDRDYTPEYWRTAYEKPRRDYEEDRLLWIAKIPDTPYYRVTMDRSHAIHYLHERHPRLQEILKIAAEAIRVRQPVSILYGGPFICDLREVTAKK